MRLIDQDGRPVEGEHVAVGRAGAVWGEWSESIADQSGHARFTDLPTGEYVVGLPGRGLGTAVTVVRDETTSCTLDCGEVRRMVVRVRERSGAPVMGARVIVGIHGSEKELDAGTTDGPGTLRISADGYYDRVRATKEGVAPSPWVRTAQVAHDELVVVLDGKEARLRGQVVDGSGHGVEAAEVLVRAAPIPGERHRILFQTRSGPGGNFQMEGLPAEEIELLAREPRSGSQLLSMELEQGDNSAVLVLEEHGTLHGVVYAAGEVPVPGAQIEVHAAWLPGPVPGVRSLEDGGYSATVPALGPVRVVARDGSLGEAWWAGSLDPGEDILWNPTLSRGSVLSGTLVDSQGTPLGGWYVRAEARGQRTVGTRVDADGNWNILNCKGRTFTVEAYQGRSSVPHCRMENVPAGSSDLRLVAVPPRLGSLRGLVVSSSTGRPLEGVRVLATRKGSTSMASGTTRGDGTFDLPDLLVGKYEVACRRPEVQVRQAVGLFTVSDGPQVSDCGVLTLQDPCHLVVEFHFADDRPPPMDLRVRAVRAGPESVALVESSAGLWRSDGLLPGSYEVRVAGTGISTLQEHVEVPEEGTEVEIEVRPGRSCVIECIGGEGISPQDPISILVTGSSQDPRPQRYRVDPPGGEYPTGLHMGLEPGSYRVLAFQLGRIVGNTNFTVPAAQGDGFWDSTLAVPLELVGY